MGKVVVNDGVMQWAVERDVLVAALAEVGGVEAINANPELYGRLCDLCADGEQVYGDDHEYALCSSMHGEFECYL